MVSSLDQRKLVVNAHHYAGHPTEADQPEECFILFMRSFYNLFLPSALPSFAEFWEMLYDMPRDTAKAMYEYYKLNLQLLLHNHSK